MTDKTSPEFKMVLLGDGGVGKTTFLKRHMTGEFEKKYVPTLGVEVRNLDFMTSRGPIRFNVWDTAGQERYRAVASSYYRGAVGALIVYDITNHKTFMNVDNWVQELKQKGPKGMCVLLVGNKTDLADD